MKEGVSPERRAITKSGYLLEETRGCKVRNMAISFLCDMLEIGNPKKYRY